MDAVDESYAQLTDRFVAWAEQEPEVRAALVIGSRARSDHPADRWSDLDLLLFVRDPERLAHAEEWVSALGPIWFSFVGRTPNGDAWERHALYAGGLDVDFALNPADWLDYILANGLVPNMAAMIRRGVRVLVDKDGRLARVLQLPLGAAAAPGPPCQAEFLQVVSDFWYHSLWTAKHLRRGELWRAKAGCDWKLKELLQQMIVWHAGTTGGQQQAVWPDGRFLEEWADPRAVARLGGVFAGYNARDIPRALQATMDLFRWLARETAERQGYDYPADSERAVSELVGKLLADQYEVS